MPQAFEGFKDSAIPVLDTEPSVESKEAEKQLLWFESQKNPIIQESKKEKNLQQIIDSLDKESVEKAFEKKKRVLVCADGRVLSEDKDCVKFGIAGAGICLSEEDLEKLSEAQDIEAVYSHEDCGAAQGVHGKEKGDDEGRKFAMALAEKISSKSGRKVMHRHVTLQGGKDGKMANRFHNERAICLDATGRFNPISLKEMPAHFMCSAASEGISDEAIKGELKVLINNVAMKHGFADYFDKDNPLHVFVSAKSKEELDKFMALAEEANEQGDRVKIDGFVHELK